MRLITHLSIFLFLLISISSCFQNPDQTKRLRRFYSQQDRMNSTNTMSESGASRSPSSYGIMDTKEVVQDNDCHSQSHQFSNQHQTVNFLLCNLGNGIIKVEFTTDDNGERTCFIPTYKYKDNPSSGYYNKSFYIGNPNCTNHQSNEVLTGTLRATRPNYSHFKINAMMVMKESSVNLYLECLKPGLSNEARNQICNQFRNNTGYLDIDLD